MAYHSYFSCLQNGDTHTHVGCVYSQGKFLAGWRHWLLYRAENKVSFFAVDEVIKSLKCVCFLFSTQCPIRYFTELAVKVLLIPK